MILEIKVLGWNRHKDVAGLNRLMASNPSHLDNWISNTKKTTVEAGNLAFVLEQAQTCGKVKPFNKILTLSWLVITRFLTNTLFNSKKTFFFLFKLFTSTSSEIFSQHQIQEENPDIFEVDTFYHKLTKQKGLLLNVSFI
jgi:hypothetical protein